MIYVTPHTASRETCKVSATKILDTPVIYIDNFKSNENIISVSLQHLSDLISALQEIETIQKEYNKGMEIQNTHRRLCNVCRCN